MEPFAEEINTTLVHTRDLACLYAHLSWIICADSGGKSSSARHVKSKIGMLLNAKIKLMNALQEFISDQKMDILRNELKEIMVKEQDKVEIVVERKHRPPHIVLDRSAIINTTNILIPEDILMALSWGEKFIFPHNINESNIMHFMAEIEHTLDRAIPIATKDCVSKQLRDEINKLMIFEFDPNIQWLKFVQYRTEKFLEKNKNIRVVNSDKGNCTVVVDADKYNDKINKFVNNSHYFAQLLDDPIENLRILETKFISILKNNEKTKHFIVAFEPNTLSHPKLYGSIKHHKDPINIRPIVSTVGSPGYTLGGIVNVMLTRIFPLSACHIDSIRAFKMDIDKIQLKENDRLVSFDVVSMYSNIHADSVIQIINQKIQKFKTVFGIAPVLMIQILAFLLKEVNYLQTHTGELYKMNLGLPMGGPISAIAARLVIDDIYDRTFTEIGVPIFYRTYVDDSLFVLGKEQVNKTFETLNACSKHLKFTMEKEVGNQINFLNLTLIRETPKIVTNWYRKPFASKRLVNFYSAHKRSTIRNTAIQHIRTVIELSDGRFFHDNKEKVVETLRANNYPETTIIALMNEYYTLMRPTISENKNERNQLYVGYPHTIRNMTLKNCIRQYMQNNVVLAESVKNTKISFVKKIKKTTKLEDKGNVILVASCVCKKKTKICQSKYNETGKMLIERIKGKKEKCDGDFHTYRRLKLHNGMYYRGQTTQLVKQLNWINRKKIPEPADFPNRYLRK